MSFFLLVYIVYVYEECVKNGYLTIQNIYTYCKNCYNYTIVTINYVSNINFVLNM